MKKGAQILDRFKKKLDFVFFPLGLSNFWVGAWFPFDEGQSTQHLLKINNVSVTHYLLLMNMK